MENFTLPLFDNVICFPPSLPLHPAQQEVYYDQITDADQPHYNVGGYIVLKGRLDREKLKQAIKRSPKVFDALRLKFDFSEGAPRGKFTGDAVEMNVVELDFSKAKTSREDALDWMHARFNKAFILEENQLFEHALLRISELENWLYCRYHHLVTDGSGFAIGAQYVANKYSSLVGALVEPVNFQYYSYEQEIIKASQYLDSESYRNDALYWQEQFRDVPEPLLKKRYSQDKVRKSQSHTLVIEVTEAQRTMFEALTRQTKASLQHLSLAALTIYFARTENTEELVIGIPVHNRLNKQQRRTFGMFAGIIPFKGCYRSEQLLIDFLQEIRTRQRNDYRHQSYPISHLNRALHLIATGRQQVFDVEVNYALLDL